MAMNTKAQYYIIANWKMHGSRTFVEDFMQSLLKTFVPDPNVHLILCPPALYAQSLLEHMQPLKIAGIDLGAQTVFSGAEGAGAFTGEMSAAMFRDMGYRYVITGHSERRQYFGEDEAAIVRQSLAAYNAGLVPIVCVGETQAQREAGQTFKVIENQLESFLSNASLRDCTRAIIAYEPVWAIGTGLVATPEEAGGVHAWIRTYVASWDTPLAKGLSIVYGGSVKLDSADGLLSQAHINGLLIGGASKDPMALVGIYNRAVAIWNNSF
jgi:triosephosphate isomerase (TIM)